MKYKTIAYTEIGKRKENQDNVLVTEKDDLVLATVADGMGGHVGGARASRIVNETFKKEFEKQIFSNTSHKTIVEWLDKTSTLAQKNLVKFASENKELSDMGSTLVVAIVAPDKIHILNIGDSRAYIFKNKKLYQITNDQNLRQHLINTQTINFKNYGDNAFGNVLMSSLGPTKSTKKEYYEILQDDKQILVLTSDGVHDYIDKTTFEKTLAKRKISKATAKQLVNKSLYSGSKDNLSVVLVGVK